MTYLTSDFKRAQITTRLKCRLRYLAPHRFVNLEWTPLNVAVADCVSFHGYHYREGSAHPLQKYALGLERGTNLRELRRDFVEFLRHYRPINAAQALGLPDLESRLPMWILPWKRALSLDFVTRLAWYDSLTQCRDILTRFSDEGIASYRIEEEWLWSDRAQHSLRLRGYDPVRGVLRAHSLFAKDGREAHLLTDGNHRAAALCAMGVERVPILSETRYQAYESEVDSWPGVASGQFSRAAALRIFHRYIEGNDLTRTTDVAAPIIAPAGWLELYS